MKNQKIKFQKLKLKIKKKIEIQYLALKKISGIIIYLFPQFSSSNIQTSLSSLSSPLHSD